MKKSLIIISLIFALFATSFAQEVKDEPTGAKTTEATADNKDGNNEDQICHHRINMHLGGAWSNNIYHRIPVFTENYSLSAIFDFQYAYFFNQHWGLGLGVSLSNIYGKASIDASGVIPQYEDQEFNNDQTLYDLYYAGNGIKEKQSVMALEIPLQAQFEWKFNQKIGIYAALGLKAYIPLYAKNRGNGTDVIETSGYEDFTHAYYHDMANHFGEYAYSKDGGPNIGMASNKVDKNQRMRASVDLIADFGALFTMSPKADFYLGAYCGVGFLNILPKENYTSFLDENGIHGSLGSDALQHFDVKRDKWRTVNVGLKIGVHIKPCAHLNRESMKDLKRRYMNEMMKKNQEPIIVKNQEYVYIVPVCDDLVDDEEDDTPGTKKLTPKDKAALKELADVLSKTKILFDLDKDIPKIADYNDNINRTVEIMKANPSFGLQIEGYTCDLGSEQHNRDLAQRRAEKVRQMFIDKGVPANQISTVTYTVNDPQNKQNIPDARREEHRAAIFRILVN
ncbi:MAG: OmpA family protein [Bacteroidales bacterium]|nr:OmpA family protein [Bacteroidales bacterium]